MDLSALNSNISRWLGNTNTFWFTFYTAGAAFSLYTCVYVLRKTFSVATFDEQSFLSMDLKVWMVIFQVIGYAMSKFAGIKLIAELKAHFRFQGILLATSIAALSWLLFAITPMPYNIIFLFTNGFPLGLTWGMIFSYLEGRKTTEALGAGLSISFIFSSGFAKSAGAWIIQDWGISEIWMPFVASCVSFLPLIFFLWLLDRVPPPSLPDEQLRTRRNPMNGAERKKFVIAFLPGIIFFILAYIFLTAFRDLRDNFSAEVWIALGYANSPEIFTRTEIPVSLAVLSIMGSIMFVKDNMKALMINHIVIISGAVIIGINTHLFEAGLLQPEPWIIFTGLGLYLGYVPFNSIFFDRLLATFKYPGTVGFIMYLADSFGYLGSVIVLFFKEFGYTKNWLDFFILSGYIASFTSGILTIASMVYFHFRRQEWFSGLPKDSLSVGEKIL